MQISPKPSKMHNLYLLPLKNSINNTQKREGAATGGNSRKRTCWMHCSQQTQKKTIKQIKTHATEHHIRRSRCNFVSFYLAETCLVIQMNPNSFHHTTRVKTSYRFKRNVQIWKRQMGCNFQLWLLQTANIVQIYCTINTKKEGKLWHVI